MNITSNDGQIKTITIKVFLCFFLMVMQGSAFIYISNVLNA